MTTGPDDLNSLLQGVTRCKTAKPEDFRMRFTGNADAQEAILQFVKTVKGIPGVGLKFQHGGISFYCHDRSGRERECGHFAILADGRIVVYQHGNVPDPMGIFCKIQKTKPSTRHGHIAGTADETDYVCDIFTKSVRRLENS